MKKDNDHWSPRKVIGVIVMLAVIALFVAPIIYLLGKHVDIREPQPVPAPMEWVYTALIAVPVLHSIFRAIKKRRNPAQARDDEIAEDDERGRAIKARAESSTLSMAQTLLMLVSLVMMFRGETVLYYALYASYWAVELIKLLYTLHYKRTM
ncbi:MAG: hypothetical protein LBN30_00405 [Oscillospiraceae bacterium]|jgi:hypothetical protein|nr:hypothetical protein [Oscillospiraceae bacterium]